MRFAYGGRGARSADTPVKLLQEIYDFLERWSSGRRHSLGKRADVKASRGFEPYTGVNQTPRSNYGLGVFFLAKMSNR